MIKKLLAFITGTATALKQRPVADSEVSENDLPDEEQEKYIQHVELVKIACRFAETSLIDIDGSGSEDDIYGNERLEEYVRTALAHSEEIQDGFFRSAALNLIADLLSKAGQYDRASNLIEQISEDFIQEKATVFLAQQKKSV